MYQIEYIPGLPRKVIEDTLQLVFLKSKVIEIQINNYDNQARHFPSRRSKFTRIEDETYLLLEDGRFAGLYIGNIKTK